MVEAKHVGPAEQNDGAWKTKRQNKERLSGKGVSPLVCAQQHVLKHHVTVATPFKICLDRAARCSWEQEAGLTLVELRRLRHLDSVDRTLSPGERHQRHRPVLVLKHAVLALQVETVQDCRRNEITVSNAISLIIIITVMTH